MSKGFSFNQSKCVNCGSCSAACILYNEWDKKPRNIYIYNEQLLHNLPLVNISLACNHCENAACLERCPSAAYSRNDKTGAVILNEERCLGCLYCQWNCPYDAPKFSSRKRIIEKCHLCYKTDDQPACADACPTGALSFRDLQAGKDLKTPEWFPSGKLHPALELTGRHDPDPLKIIPSARFTQDKAIQSEGKISGEWSLIIFSFMAMVAVSISSASLIKGVFPGISFFILLVAAAMISLFHLGKPLRAWRVLMHPVGSPLSREIISFLIFFSLMAFAVLLRSPVFLLAGSISGLILLVVIDSVYFIPAKNAMYHSGQTFFSSLLLISYLTGNLFPFTFIAIIKVLLSVRVLSKKDHEAFRFIRIALLVLAWAGLVSGYAVKSNPLTIMILSAELIDRYLFYLDFRPENIKHLIEKK
jgi:Fe-S-cluster-containing dehydrogenase component/DMSO reductase anchor subunit